MSLKKTEASDRIVLCDSFALCRGGGIYIYIYTHIYICYGNHQKPNANDHSLQIFPSLVGILTDSV